MDQWWITLLATVLLIVLSAFFVIIEFSLLAARRHRLEDQAVENRSARAAVRNLNELTVLLAGAQLGITACTFALGAVTKPAVHYAMMPLFEFMPLWAADAVAFGLSLLLVTFLHLVVGEMAPKSWAIAHPELSAKVVALPARAFIWVFRPMLLRINAVANRLVAATGVEPVDRAAAAGYDAETIGHLVEASTRAGALDEASGEQISSIIRLEQLTVDDVLEGRTGELASVGPDAVAAEVQELARSTGHLRILVEAEAGSGHRLVHVRDTLLAQPRQPVSELSRPAMAVAEGTSVYEAFRQMRENGEQLAVVCREGREAPLGVVTWNDILRIVWPAVEASR